MTTTIEQGILYRDFRFDRREIDEKARTVRISLSSSEPCVREFGMESLSHAPGAIRLERLTAGMALLFNHDRHAHLGRLTNPRVEGGKLIADAVFSRSALGEEKFRDAMDGILTDSSVGYIVHKFQVDETEDVFTAIDWEPIEGSLCTIPAALNTGVGRSHHNETFTAEIIHPTMTPSPSPSPAPNRGKLERIQALEFFKRKYPGYVQQWERIYEAGGGNDEMTDFTRENNVASRSLVAPGGGNRPLLTRDGGDYSRGGERTLGARIVEHPDFQMLQRGGRKLVSLEFPDVANIRSAMQTRAVVGTADFGGTVTHTGAPVFALEILTISDLLAGGVTASGTVRYPRENASPVGAAAVAEGALKPEVVFDVDPIDAIAKKFAAWVRISDELLQDSPAAESYLNTRLQHAVLKAEDAQLLVGDGTGPNLLGILNTPGTQVQPAGADSPTDCIRKAIGKIAAGTDFQASGVVIHPNDWMRISITKDANGQYLLGNVFLRNEIGNLIKAPSIWGLPVAVSKLITESTVLVGAFNIAAQLFRRTGLIIEASNSDGNNFVQNMVTIRAEQRGALAVYSPAAFVKCTGL